MILTTLFRQVEFYFGDSNLPRDKFLREKIDEDSEVLAGFNQPLLTA